MNIGKETVVTGCEFAAPELSMDELEHELRTPLTSIRLALEILRDCPDLGEDQRQHFLAVLLDDEARLTRTVERLLESPRLRRWPA